MRQPKGQNFLIDTSVARAIIDLAGLSAHDTVLEIGPGKGVLTGLIASKVKKVLAVEIDRVLALRLKEKFRQSPQVTIVPNDFMAYDLSSLGPGVKIVANLPYNMATAIIEKILPAKNWASAVLMVQQEVGQRICACVHTKAYNAFSIFCQYYAHGSLHFTVEPRCFMPPPKVTSVVLSLANKQPPIPDPLLFTLIKAAFLHKRKTIVNTLAFFLENKKELLLDALKKSGIDPSLRPENLPLKSYQDLTSIVKKSIIVK